MAQVQIENKLSAILSMLPELDRGELLTVIAAAQSLTARGTRKKPKDNPKVSGNKGPPSASVTTTTESKTSSGSKKEKKDKGKYRNDQAKHARYVSNRYYIDYKSAEKRLSALLKADTNSSRPQRTLKALSNGWLEPSGIKIEQDYLVRLNSHDFTGLTREEHTVLYDFFVKRWRWFREKDATDTVNRSGMQQATISSSTSTVASSVNQTLAYNPQTTPRASVSSATPVTGGTEKKA